MATPAIPADPLLDGVRLAVAASEWRIQHTEARTLRELAGGGFREQFAPTAPDLPPVAVTRRFALSWQHARELRQTLGELLAVPGIHRLILWRPEDLAWIGDGSRTEFRLPNGWSLALDDHDPPGNVDPARFLSLLRVGYAGTPLTTLSLAPESYDEGDPDPGEALFSAGESRFKLGAAPASGEVVYGTVFPVYRVLRGVEAAERSYTGPLREPLDLVLVEHREEGA